MNADKVIVTNRSALRAKYGIPGMESILAAVDDLIAADRRRGLTTVLVILDTLRTSRVKDPLDLRQNKKAVDALFHELQPHYLVLLGSLDVIPHQALKNPLYSPPNGDTDEFVFADLPYACDAAFSQDIRDFCGPTRVVGRLPDVTGGKDPAYLVGLLKTAARRRSRPRSEYQDYLGISAEAWRRSTAKSLIKTFRSARDLRTSPQDGYEWDVDLLNRRMHFINCHGATVYPNFLGESLRNSHHMPISHRADFVARRGKILEGTVVAAECCYGGELYDPSLVEGQLGMCNTYLARKAYGFFGSTTMAYGSAKGNAQADLICQYFLQSVLAGASLGRAALEARLRFVRMVGPLSLTDRKTLAQFNLYGDPSIVPVAPEDPAVARAKRRERLRAHAIALAKAQSALIRSLTPKSVSDSLRRMMAQSGAEPVDTFSFGSGGGNMSHAMVGVVKQFAELRRLIVLQTRKANGNTIVGESHSK